MLNSISKRLKISRINIQIQPMLMLNLLQMPAIKRQLNSNTTYVNVKLLWYAGNAPAATDSNTTYVNVKHAQNCFVTLTYNEFKYNLC